jgi:tRNA nucleotidyltransferase (CCA-adding enzyme)
MLPHSEENFGKPKKLATAVSKVFGLDLDLVNLCKEVYEEDDWMLSMEFGTAEEDAFRRDATVNALLFYLDTLKVVDYYEEGSGRFGSGKYEEQTWIYY